MPKPRILIVSQGIAPYLPADEISSAGRELAVGAHGNGYEVRTFMPRYATVNERRNQLHEVIRLSGMNIMVGEAEHPLMLKVASMQPSRIQVYFIDNDDFFQNTGDTDVYGVSQPDVDRRAVFFARGTVETVKKLRWEPAIVHVDGWMSALTPLYLRRLAADEGLLGDVKIVYSVLPGVSESPMDAELLGRILADAASPCELPDGISATAALHRLAIAHSDAVVFHTADIDENLAGYARSLGLPVLDATADDFDQSKLAELYKKLTVNE